MVPRNFPGVLEIFPDNGTGKESHLHKNYREFGENGNGEFEYFFKHLLPRIDPPQIKYKKKKDYCKHFFDMSFTVSDEAFGMLKLDHKLEVQHQQFEAKQNDPNVNIQGPEYQKEYVEDLLQKGPPGWSAEGRAIYYNLKESLTQLREMKQGQTDKYLMNFCSAAGVKVYQYNSGKQHKVQENERDDSCKWSRLLKGKQDNICKELQKWNCIVSTSSGWC